jgi:hypothetical protein
MTIGSRVQYFVRATVAGAPKEMDFPFDRVGKALEQACAFLKTGATNVSIRDADGHQIDGSALEDCCQRGMIQHDLKPVTL